ncbi:unnamed protein product [Caenorhabditis auriculariae]|uniref:Uncharacterized protein n=1 Tax=Caenorhabditis auriculariae TaxID=2777116 RepID=A0A8S1HFD7_9PELO|nr:unnamed protein product [Caenorhabditis auriculariae]
MIFCCRLLSDACDGGPLCWTKTRSRFYYHLSTYHLPSAVTSFVSKLETRVLNVSGCHKGTWSIVSRSNVRRTTPNWQRLGELLPIVQPGLQRSAMVYSDKTRSVERVLPGRNLVLDASCFCSATSPFTRAVMTFCVTFLRASRLVKGNQTMSDASGGWNQGRRQYRSVAFGTWKVGGARQMTSSRNDSEKGKNLDGGTAAFNYAGSQFNTIDVRPPKKRPLLDVDRNSRLGESSPNLSRIVHHTQTTLSLGLPMNHRSSNIDQRLGNAAQDFYSSSEYCEYLHDQGNEDCDSCNGNTISEPIQAIFRASNNGCERHKSVDRQLKHSLSSRRKSRRDDVDRSHHRSHSAGADTNFAIAHSASTSAMKLTRATTAQPTEHHGSNVKFLRATKKFFKKIYSSATLPKKSTSSSNDNFQKAAAFYENQCRPATLADDDEFSSSHDEMITSRNGDRPQTAMLDVSYPDSGLEMDRSSTPDQSLESMTLHSKSDSTSSDSHSRSVTSQEIHDIGWSNIFEHLRREMNEMRERDAQILADLHKVESQLQSVKLSQLGYADSSSRSNLELVESMQL